MIVGFRQVYLGPFLMELQFFTNTTAISSQHSSTASFQKVQHIHEVSCLFYRLMDTVILANGIISLCLALAGELYN